jgi:hypothetical protein
MNTSEEVYVSAGWSGTKSAITGGLYWPIVPAVDNGDECRVISGTNECQGKPEYSEETCPIEHGPSQLEAGE